MRRYQALTFATRFTGCVGAIFLLVGCAASGVQVTQEDIDEFEPGRTTYAEVTQQLGPPTTESFNSDGSRQAIYAYSEMSIRPETFIPYVGGLVGGADRKANSVVFNFDQQGRLQNYSGSGTAVGTARNLSSGVNLERVDVRQSPSTQ